MLFNERIDKIIEMLEREGSVSNAELTEKLCVSESTIRRDLSYLEKKGELERVHGGAIKKEIVKLERTLEENIGENVEEKKQIAKLASEFLEDGDFIYLDAGSTTYEMIKYLKNRDIRVVTNGLMHILKLLEEGIDSYLLGGHVKAPTGVVRGSLSLKYIEDYNFTRGFFGANGVDVKSGITTADQEEAELKIKAIERSQESYFLVDSNKFGKVHFSKITNIDKINIITDNNKKIPKKMYEKANIIGG